MKSWRSSFAGLVSTLVLCGFMLMLMQAGEIAAARPMGEELVPGKGYLVIYPYEQARTVVATWMDLLAAGPSPKGPGH
uniref:Uncharacterized protein n=1 Tax=Nymphaea colorata TaxID=210225 RepID=A0A5K1B0K2_9MAGN